MPVVATDKLRAEAKGLTIDTIRSKLSYEPGTGKLTWKTGKCRGKIAGHFDASVGYLIVTVSRCHFLAHRLAWALYYGAWPNEFLDHKDHDKLNNRIANLRSATASENMRNRPVQRNSTSGAIGVTRVKSQWKAQITVSGKRIHIGLFNSVEEASAAYQSFAVSAFGEFYFREQSK